MRLILETWRYYLPVIPKVIENSRDASDLRRHDTCTIVLLSTVSTVWDTYLYSKYTLQWRHNGRGGITNHLYHDCLFNRLFKAQIKESIKVRRHWPLWELIHRWPAKSPQKGPVRLKCFHLMTSSWVTNILDHLVLDNDLSVFSDVFYTTFV